MEAKSFFSKSSNIFSVAILLVGLTTFTTGVAIVDKQADKYNNKISDKNKYIEKLENELYEKNVELDTLGSRENQYKSKVEGLTKNNMELLKDNADLKKKIEYYKDRSEGPTLRNNLSRGEDSKQKISFEATAYTAYCSEGCTGKTATGHNVSNRTKINGYNVVAVDTSVVPMYSLLKIETRNGTYYAQALDRGGAIKGHKLDLLVSNERVARKFGRQKVSVTVLRWGK